MKVAMILLAGAMFLSPALAQAQATANAGLRPARSDLVKVPPGRAATPARNAAGTDRVIDDELRRIDHMMTICTGC